MADEQNVHRPKTDIAPGYTFGTVTDQIASVVLTKRTPIFWFISFGAGLVLLLLFLLAVGVLFAKGTGIWGLRTPVMWGFAITNFVWWIGIGHAARSFRPSCCCSTSAGATPSTASPKP